MTAIIGFSLGSYALLVADTRVTSHAIRDDELKVGRTPWGLISGSGSGGFVRSIINESAQEQGDVEQLLYVVAKVRGDAEKHFADDAEIAERIDATGFILTYYG